MLDTLLHFVSGKNIFILVLKITLFFIFSLYIKGTLKFTLQNNLISTIIIIKEKLYEN